MRKLPLRAALLVFLACGAALAQAQTSADYTHGVDVSASTATIWFKPTQTSTTWVDVHYQLNGGAMQRREYRCLRSR